MFDEDLIYVDFICGEVIFFVGFFLDFVVVCFNGVFLYIFVNFVDDVLMGIIYVLCGEDFMLLIVC